MEFYKVGGMFRMSIGGDTGICLFLFLTTTVRSVSHNNKI